MIPMAVEVLAKKDIFDFLETVSLLKPDCPSLKSVRTLADFELTLPLLLQEKPSVNKQLIILNYFSILRKNDEFSLNSNKLLTLTQENKCQSQYFNMMGTHAIRNKQYREGIRFFEQSLLYEANTDQRNEIFLKIAFSLYNLGSLQALHYITIIKTGKKELLGRMALIDGLVHWDILKKLGKSIQAFRTAWQYLDESNERYFRVLSSVYLADICKIFGDDSSAETHRQEVEAFFSDKLELSLDEEFGESDFIETESFTELDDPTRSLFNSVGKVPLHELEKKYILFVLNNSKSLDHACKTLGIDRKTLYNKRKNWNIV